MTKDHGRGIFATKNLKKGDLILVEKAIASANSFGDDLKLMTKG